MVEEMWPRYGSFPGFNPIVELSLTFHNLVVGANGQRQAMFLENTPALPDVYSAILILRPRQCLDGFVQWLQYCSHRNGRTISKKIKVVAILTKSIRKRAKANAPKEKN